MTILCTALEATRKAHWAALVGVTEPTKKAILASGSRKIPSVIPGACCNRTDIGTLTGVLFFGDTSVGFLNLVIDFSARASARPDEPTNRRSGSFIREARRSRSARVSASAVNIRAPLLLKSSTRSARASGPKRSASSERCVIQPENFDSKCRASLASSTGVK